VPVVLVVVVVALVLPPDPHCPQSWGQLEHVSL
jgi:hypothetical protein